MFQDVKVGDVKVFVFEDKVSLITGDEDNALLTPEQARAVGWALLEAADFLDGEKE